MKIESELNEKTLSSLTKHLYGIPECFVEMELKDFNLIHPRGDEDWKHLLDDKPRFDLNVFEDNQEIPELKNKGGVYCLIFKGDKTVYFGETVNFNIRLREHHKCFNRRKRSLQRQLINAYERAGSQAEVVLVESGFVNDYSKAEFKMYCLKREHYYCELYKNNKQKLYNYENTLHNFYVSYGRLYGDFRNAITRATSMEFLEKMAQEEVDETSEWYQNAIRKWERIQEVLKARKQYEKGGSHVYAIKTTVNPSNAIKPVYYVKANSEAEARAKLAEHLESNQIQNAELVTGQELRDLSGRFWSFDIA